MITKKYYKLVKVSYEDEGYFYMKNVSNSIGHFSVIKMNGGPWHNAEYSLDGANWESYDLTTLPSIDVNPNSNIYIRGDGAFMHQSYGWRYKLTMDVDYIIGGNIYSLVDKSGFATRTTSLANRELSTVFEDDTHLIGAADLNFGNVTTLNNECYSGMFNGCANLTTAPELPATTLAQHCYDYMFQGCTSLTTAPELPATTLELYCYSQMFNGCTALTTGPNILAPTFASYSCGSMFYNCRNLQSVKTAVATWNTDNAYNWLSGVSASGTIYAPNGSDIANYSGASGVPSGWTVVYY